MNDKQRIWLYDILTAIMEIDSFLTEASVDFAAYQNDLRTKRAVEREIEIIGEAMSRLLKQDETLSITNARQIVDTRNRIIHGYDTVSDQLIWSIVSRYLPILRREVEQLLAE